MILKKNNFIGKFPIKEYKYYKGKFNKWKNKIKKTEENSFSSLTKKFGKKMNILTNTILKYLLNDFKNNPELLENPIKINEEIVKK